MNICLNMIVRNESRVIERCLTSVKPFITSWCIVDTGSTDSTRELIERCLSNIPGSLHEREWRGHGHNRNEALDLAYVNRPDYILLIDADEQLEGALPEKLEADWYTFNVRYGSIEYPRAQLLSTKHTWRWISTGKRCQFHPLLRSPTAKVCTALPGVQTLVSPDGSSWSDPEKFTRLLPLLELDLIDEPGNARLVYYAAQTCKDAKAYERAIELYIRRSQMPGWEEEGWSAQLAAAKLLERTGKPFEDVRTAYLNAFARRPRRVEPLYHLARMCRQHGRLVDALAYASAGVLIRRPANDHLFVEHEVYSHRMARELDLAKGAFSIG